ncbi:MAG: class I SAM-dependent methyltransferase [Mycobacteriales bacterium]
MPTRGTTNPNRLRRIDRHLVEVHRRLLLEAADPLVVDLGYGATPITAVELHARVRAVRPDAQVVGIEIDQARVDAAAHAVADGLSFVRGGFELAGLRPLVIRAFNVLRQYDEQAAAHAWLTMLDRLQHKGILLEGTCDEVGRRAAWVTLSAAGPQTLTLACAVDHLDRPSSLAERLPKALIHHNVPGTRVHALLTELDRAWAVAAPLGTFGNRQRWAAMLAGLEWEQVGRRRDGELTVPWPTVDPG